jgi:ribosomal protein S18 acetylase RimI-like enzyme
MGSPGYKRVMQVTLRPGRADDHAAFTRLFAELGIHDPVPGAERFAQAIVPMLSVACRNDDVVGYITWRQYGTTAHVGQLAVDASTRGQRIGEHLLEHVRKLARDAGCTRWYLNVKRDNAPALRLYDRVGLRLEFESVAMKLAWDRAPRVDVRHRLADPDEDALIGARFDVPKERITAFRARASYKLVTLRDDFDAILGFAAFDPSFPGVATFCAEQARYAVPLLAAVRQYADPAFDFVRVTVEGHRPVADAILALGAELTFELLRLSAPL